MNGPATRHFLFRPLTPVHIGSGERLSPEGYVIDEKTRELVRLDIPAMFARFTSDERKAFETAIDGGRLRDAQAVLQKRWVHNPAQRGDLERYRTRLGPASYDQLKQILVQPGRSGEVLVLPRNEVTGQVTIPGSALKGALRTALVSWLANPEGRPDVQLKSIAEGSRLEQQQVLQYEPRTLYRDPFRHVRVSDAAWPAANVQIDMPLLTKLGRDTGQSSGIQMHYERLLSAADSRESAHGVPLVITVDEDRMSKTGTPQPLTWDLLLSACQRFFAQRFKAESDRFPLANRTYWLWAPSQQDWDRGCILIRIGRHCHFDSASVDNFRRKPTGPGRRIAPAGTGDEGERQQIGSTRTMCEVQTGQLVPFGWALLEPVN